MAVRRASSDRPATKRVCAEEHMVRPLRPGYPMCDTYCACLHNFREVLGEGWVARYTRNTKGPSCVRQLALPAALCLDFSDYVAMPSEAWTKGDRFL
eukprot:2996522-Pyramimonas_sp.AAC.1